MINGYQRKREKKSQKVVLSQESKVEKRKKEKKKKRWNIAKNKQARTEETLRKQGSIYWCVTNTRNPNENCKSTMK